MSDTGDRPVSVSYEYSYAVYRAAHSDPKWAVSELLTEALGTLRAIAIPHFHTGEQAAARASEAIACIERAAAEKLAEMEGDDDAR